MKLNGWSVAATLRVHWLKSPEQIDSAYFSRIVGTRTAVLRIQRANQEVARQLIELDNARKDLTGALIEGREAVQILVDGKEVDTLAGHVDLRHPLTKSLEWVVHDTQ